MTQQVINTGAVANDGTGESLRNAFDAVNNNFANIWTAGPVDSQVIISNNRISTTVQNLALVLAGNGVGTITVDSTVVPGIDSVYDLGTANSRFNSVYSRYFYGNGAFLSGISNGSGSATSVTFAATPPLAANIGDIWIQSDTGIQYLYFNDNTSNQWAEMEAYQSFSSGGTGNGNVDLTNVSSDIIPSTNNSYSLGNSVRQWKDLWVSNSTIYLNSLPITADGANLKVNGNTVLTTSSPLSFSNLSVTGNVSANAVYTNNYFYANGAPFPQGSNSLPGTTISLKDNVIATTTLNQNLVLSANGVGNVQTNSSIMPDATQVRDIGSASNRFNSIYAGYYYGNGSQLTGISAGNSNSIISGNSNVKIVTAGGNVTIGIGGIGNIVVVSGAGEFVTGVVSASGNITAPYFVGNGSLLTGITTVAAANTAQTVTANAQANITSVGTLTSLSVTGTVQGGNILTSGIVSSTGNITGNYFIGNGSQLTGLPATYGNANVVANLAALGSNPVSTTGNITGNYFIGNGSQLTGLPATYGNSNVVANLAALGSNPVSTTGNITGGNLTTAGIANVATLAVTGSATVQGSISIFSSSTSLSATGNVIGGNLLTGGLISATGNITGGNLSGTNITGTLTTAAQANITTVGTLGNLAVSGQANITQQINTARVSATGNITVGNVLTGGLISATGNVSGNFFIGNGSALTGISAAANTGNVTFSDQAVVGTGDSTGAGGLYLAPGNTSVGNLQYLRVRGGDVATHIHFDTGNNAYFDQYFGDDGQYVKLEAAGNVQIGSNDSAGNSAQWTFGTDGNLTFPTGNLVIIPDDPAGNIASIASADHPLAILSTGANGAVASLWIEDYANVGTSNIAAVYANPTPGSKIVRIAVGQNGSPGPNFWDFTPTGNLSAPGAISAVGNITGNFFVGNGSQLTGVVSSYGNANVVANLALLGSNPVSTTGNITAGYLFGNGSQLTGLAATYSNSNVTTLLAALGSNTISGTGNITTTANISGGFILGNGSQLTGITASYGNANVVANLAALGSNPISTTGNISGNYFIGNGSQLTSVATQLTGSWTLAAGTNTVSLTVPGPGTYSIWVNGNIPNGIVTYTATIVVTNTNVPVVGSSYGWYYAAGNALVLTAIPNQIVGTPNTISTAVVATTTANVFTFGITNNSGSSQVVNYGYTKL